MKKLVEDIALWEKSIEPQKLSEAQVMKEAEEQKINILGGYKVPVWVLDVENLNGRTYPTELGERIVAENAITPALDGHPVEEIGIAFEDVKAVSKNPSIEDGVLWVETYFVDEDYFNKIERILYHESQVGLSSVGFGEMDENGVIDPESYGLVRYMDFVLNPSYGVYIQKDNTVNEGSEEEETSESVSTETEEQSSAEDVISDDELEYIKSINQIKQIRRKL